MNILTGKEEKILNDAHDCPVVNFGHLIKIV